MKNEALVARNTDSLWSYRHVAARGYQCFTYEYKEDDFRTMEGMIMFWGYSYWLIDALVDDDDLPDNVKIPLSRQESGVSDSSDATNHSSMPTLV